MDTHPVGIVLGFGAVLGLGVILRLYQKWIDLHGKITNLKECHKNLHDQIKQLETKVQDQLTIVTLQQNAVAGPQKSASSNLPIDKAEPVSQDQEYVNELKASCKKLSDKVTEVETTNMGLISTVRSQQTSIKALQTKLEVTEEQIKQLAASLKVTETNVQLPSPRDGSRPDMNNTSNSISSKSPGAMG